MEGGDYYLGRVVLVTSISLVFLKTSSSTTASHMCENCLECVYKDIMNSQSVLVSCKQPSYHHGSTKESEYSR